MLRVIEGLPEGVLGIEAVGKVTHEDYRDVLIPKAQAMMAKGPISMLYVIGKEASGFALEALWDDSTFGLRHWRDFSRIAVVTDQAWLRAAVSLFAPLTPAEVRLFATSALPEAKRWIAEKASG